MKEQIMLKNTMIYLQNYKYNTAKVPKVSEALYHLTQYKPTRELKLLCSIFPRFCYKNVRNNSQGQNDKPDVFLHNEAKSEEPSIIL